MGKTVEIMDDKAFWLKLAGVVAVIIIVLITSLATRGTIIRLSEFETIKTLTQNGTPALEARCAVRYDDTQKLCYVVAGKAR